MLDTNRGKLRKYNNECGIEFINIGKEDEFFIMFNISIIEESTIIIIDNNEYIEWIIIKLFK